MYEPTTAAELFALVVGDRDQDEFVFVSEKERNDTQLLAIAIDAINGCDESYYALEQDGPTLFDALCL